MSADPQMRLRFELFAFLANRSASEIKFVFVWQIIAGVEKIRRAHLSPSEQEHVKQLLREWETEPPCLGYEILRQDLRNAPGYTLERH
jgi:hypothetical protein